MAEVAQSDEAVGTLGPAGTARLGGTEEVEVLEALDEVILLL